MTILNYSDVPEEVLQKAIPIFEMYFHLFGSVISLSLTFSDAFDMRTIEELKLQREEIVQRLKEVFSDHPDAIAEFLVKDQELFNNACEASIRLIKNKYH